jgi:hypothetical protein
MNRDDEYSNLATWAEAQPQSPLDDYLPRVDWQAIAIGAAVGVLAWAVGFGAVWMVAWLVRGRA